MTENEQYKILLPLIRGGLALRGVQNATVFQGYQPTQQGAPSGAFVYLFKLPEVPRGQVYRDTVYEQASGTMVDKEIQKYEVSYQVNTQFIQDPKNTSTLTAGDLLKKVHQVMQSSATISTLLASGIGILRVNELRNTPFVNDKNRHEFNGSFDFTITYDELWVGTAPVVETFEYNINRV